MKRHTTAAIKRWVWAMMCGLTLSGIASAEPTLRDTFSGETLSEDWEAPASNVRIADGRLVFTGNRRTYVRSVNSDWAAASFQAEITVTVAGGASGCAYFGLGEGTSRGSEHGNPDAAPSVYALCAPSGFADGVIDLRLNGVSQQTSRPGPGTGTHRLRLTWSAETKTVFLAFDRDWKGGEFERDGLLVAETKTADFTPGKARLFFGGAGDATFDDLAVTPITAADLEAFTDDFFAEMAKRKLSREAVPGMARNPVPKLPDTVLPWDGTLGKGFTPADKIDTQAELDAELQRMRAKFEPFMEDHVPALPVTRRRMALERFDYRLVSARDKPVDQEWQQVTIPHYTGPINKSEAHYRTVIDLDAAMLSQDTLFLHFQAVDYIAAVFVNGQEVGSHEGLFGAFEFDIKPFVKPGKNELLVKVYNDAIMMGDNFNVGPGRQYGKKLAAAGGPGWDNPRMGWHMCPVGSGIWQRCWLEARPAAFIHDIFVRAMPEKNEAEVWVQVTGDTQGIELSYSLYGQNFKATVAEDQPVTTLKKFTIPVPARQLRWWSLDEPWLYQLQIQLKRRGKLVDAGKRQFGMRTFVQSTTSEPKGRFYLNGNEIRLRGANMMGNLMQCVIRKDFDQLRDDILLAKIANMNFWRMTQQPCPEEVYDYFDKLGLLAQTDMPAFNGYRRDCVDSAREQLREMVRLVRGHACNALVSYVNEPGFGKPMMLDHKGHEALFRGFDEDAKALNPDQVTKWVDGDYVNLSHQFSDHHNYDMWYGGGIRGVYLGGWNATRADWMFGCGEFGAEALDSVALMKKYYPPEWLEAEPDGTWSPRHITRCQTPTTGMKWQSLTTRTMDDWVRSSREHQYWAIRLMAESLRRIPKMNSFAVHLLIDAWPAGWMKAIMDTDRQAKPAYFAYRDALTPLAVNLQPDKFYGFSGDELRVHAWVLNDTQEIPPGATLRYQVELAGEVIQTGRAPATIQACEPVFQGAFIVALPTVSTRQPVTVRLGLFDKANTLIHDTVVDLDVFPASEKGQKIDRPGGAAQRLLQ